MLIPLLAVIVVLLFLLVLSTEGGRAIVVALFQLAAWVALVLYAIWYNVHLPYPPH